MASESSVFFQTLVNKHIFFIVLCMASTVMNVPGNRKRADIVFYDVTFKALLLFF